MPYSKVEDHDECGDGEIAVVKDEDGEVMGCHATEEAADDQIAAIEANEESASPEVYMSAGGPSITVHKSAPDPEPEREPPEELQSLRSRAQEGERLSMQFQSRRTESLQATTDRLETINTQHSDRELAEDDVVIFRDFAVHNLGPQTGMRRPLKFTMGALEKFADDFRQGRTMNVHHNGERQVGTTFGAQIERNATVRGIEANWLTIDWYAPTVNASEQRLQDITDMETGVLRYTSIEFAGGDWEEETMEAPSGDDWFFLVDDNAGAGRERLEAEGIARVALGAVRGAGTA